MAIPGKSTRWRSLQLEMAMMELPSTKALSASGAYVVIASVVGLKPKQVKEIAEAMMALAAKQVQSVGSFKLAGAINIKFEKQLATAGHFSVHPITKEPWFFKAKKASQKWRIIAMKKLLYMLVFAGHLIV